MLSLRKSNNYIIGCITSNKPFFIARLGMGGETFCAHYFAINGTLDKNDQDQSLKKNYKSKYELD